MTQMSSEGICEAIVSNPKSTNGHSSTDLPKEARKCDHFTIRGFVADIQKKNSETWWFSAPHHENKRLNGQLSKMFCPLEIPKFRYWDCRKCVQTSNASVNAEDTPSLELETICFKRRDASNGFEECPMEHSDESENEAVTTPDIGQDVVNFPKRRFGPCESSDAEEKDVQNTNDQGSVDSIPPTDFTRPKKFRLISEMILREKNSDINQTKAPYQPKLALLDQTHMENGIGKKRKALHAKDNLLPKKSSKSLGKSCFYQIDQAENVFKISDSLYSNGEIHFPENGNHRKVSQNHIENEETQVPKAHHRGSKNKKGSPENHSISAKKKNTYQIQVEASPTRPKMGESNALDNIQVGTSPTRPKMGESDALDGIQVGASPTRPKPKTGESDALDDIPLEIVDFLARKQQEHRGQDARNPDQVNHFGGNQIVETAPRYNLGAPQMISPPMEQQGQIGNFAKASTYMPATELLQLMEAGLCPKSIPPSLGSSLSIEPRQNFDSNSDARVGAKVVNSQKKLELGVEICSMNRNPAEFSVPGPRNRFMITHKQLKTENTNSKRGRPRKRVMEAPIPNENAEN